MKSLTRLWFNYDPISLNKRNLVITHRLFLQKLRNSNMRDEAIYVLVNTLSGAVDLFENYEGELITSAINSRNFNDLPDYILNFLIKRGYLFVSKETEELVFDTFINDYQKRNYLEDKILAYFSLDSSCPMGCEYCFEKQNSIGDKYFEKSIMDEKSIKSAFEFLKMICSIQNKEVGFVAGWGGEPLQEKNFEINKLFMDFANENRFNIAYFSNLAFIGDKTINLLAKNADKIDFLQTTIDGLENEHNLNRKLPDAFKITVKNINRLLKLNLPVVIRTNLGLNNIDFLPNIADFYERNGWFEFSKFKGYVTHTYDRHHDFKKNFTLDEDVAFSKYLKFRDEYPAVRKIQGIKFAPALRNIIDAFKIRESLDITKEDFEIVTKPTISYCFTSNRLEYVFTGDPDYSIYTCAECTSIRKFRLGEYYPSFKIDENGKKMWGIDESIHQVRSISNLKTCKRCRAATYCGGYCALEAINANGNSGSVFCKKADRIIANFLENESLRLYKRAKFLLNNTHHITL